MRFYARKLFRDEYNIEQSGRGRTSRPFQYLRFPRLLTPFILIINSISDFSLQYDESLSLLRVEWASGHDMRTFRASVGQLLELCQRLPVYHLLLNMNTLPDISVYDQVWLGIHWMPRVVQLELKRVVLVNHRRRIHNQLAIESLIGQTSLGIRFDIQYFTQPVPGLQWLCDYSDHLPILLVEWDTQHAPASSAPGTSGTSDARPQYWPYDL